MANEVAEIERRINKDIVGGMRLGGGASGITFGSAVEAMEFAKMMAVSGAAVPAHCRGVPGVCLGIVDDAIRFGISPYALARKSYLVNGTIAYEAQVVAALVMTRGPMKARPHIAFKGEGVNRQCLITADLNDGSKVEYESPKIGTISPKNSPLWKTDPDQQLSYYSLRAMGRRHFPDVLLGVYDFDEAMTFKDITPPKTLAESLTGQKSSDGYNHTEVLAQVSAKTELTADEMADLNSIRQAIAGIDNQETLDAYFSTLAPTIDRGRIELKDAIVRVFSEWKGPDDA